MNDVSGGLVKGGWRHLAAVAAAGVLAISGAAHAIGTNILVCDMNGSQEVPNVVTDGRGCGTFVIDRAANTLSYHIVYSGLSSAETAAHIHGTAAPGASAGIAHTLPAGNVKTGVWNYPESAEDDILGGLYYVNVHTTTNPGGEIRGQIGSHVAVITGAQESAPVVTPARGWATFTIDTDANVLSYHIEYDGLSAPETASHIHGIAMHTQSAPILHTLPGGNPKIGSWNYPEFQESAILRGCMYVNIHSTAFPAGEIRGQICNAVVPIDGSQETPPVVTPGAGYAQIAIDPAANLLSYHAQYQDLTAPETAAHIHGYTGPGGTAGIVHTLPGGPTKLGIWVYPAFAEQNIIDGLTYINVHTSTNPSGEIRGQINFGAKQPCDADINGDGIVSFGDLLILLAAWGQVGVPADFDGGGVAFSDLLFLLAAWGDCV